MTHIRPKNWAEFQHYKDRSPPWIKLHKGLLDDFDYQRLPVASRALAPMLWLLASEDAAGRIDATPEKLAFRLRLSVKEVAEALKHLIEKKFFIVLQPASAGLAEVGRAARPETETETETETEEEGEEDMPADAGSGVTVPVDDADFETFWKAFGAPKNAKKPDARKAWKQVAKTRPPLDDLLRAVKGYNDWLAGEWKRNKRDFPSKQHPATWLRGEVWGGFLEQEAAATVDATAALAAWDGRAAPLVQEIGPAKFEAWFAAASFDGKVMTWPKLFQRNWVANHYAEQVHRHFGDVEFRTAA